ncbi:adenylyltransferase/cytidyltransferase family protein [Polaribacter sp. MSW13]|uniref:Adenylyltransferase/cytidyltransferase family protein n=1 Tax=Polaribacter marinus TaxID=2916838 RepID=A0A9X2ALF4_9FLAO|nr:adenylyltransferase/cytidyltransferase family protein [Polaribacter marinus]MCI2227774.1 adenylyltransferase/cytidyltransferase family protein [Polaribacter marinus]
MKEQVAIIKRKLDKEWSIVFNESNNIINLTTKLDLGVDFLLRTVKEIYRIFNEKEVAVQLNSNSEIIVMLKKSNKKYKRMYTSGCFDLFHYGHLNILEKTKKMCDYLIVGVSTDELILKEKGKVPVIPYHERKRVIESISCVDEVIAQVDKNKQKIVDDYQIDAISVGDDWKGRFPKTTCYIEYFKYTESVSSTILKNTLQLVK